MKALPFLLAGAGAAIAYVWWKNRHAATVDDVGADKDAATATLVDDACEGARKIAELAGGGAAAGQAAYLACKALGGQLHDSGAQNAQEVANRDQKNRELNGDIDLPASAAGLQGSALRFKNGCVPFDGAPGFDKCAPGTQSMWLEDTRDASSGITARDSAFPAFPNEADRVAWLGDWNGLPDDEKDATVGRVLVTRDHRAQLLTGSVDPTAPDPATHGAVGAFGKWFGFVKGQPVTCPAGQAPALWDANGKPIGDHRSGIPPCAPGGVSSFVPSTGAPPPQVSTSLGQQTIACVNGQPPPGYTWDSSAGGFLRRLRVGETPSPCPNPDAAVSRATDDSSLLAVTNGGLARRQ